MDDMGATTNWTENYDDITATESISNGDYLQIECKPDNVANEYVELEWDIASLNSNSYKNFLIRYKTSSALVQAKAQLVFSDASTQTILDLSWSQTWALASGTITPGKTIDKIRLFADDYPDSLATGTYYVYFDYVLLFKDWFTLPNTAFGLDLDLNPRQSFLDIPSRITDITQNLGSKNAVVTASCDLDQGDWKRTGDVNDAQVFDEIIHNMTAPKSGQGTSEPWQWLDLGDYQFKVTTDTKKRWEKVGDKTLRTLDLIWNEYSLGDKSVETYAERFGIGL